MANPRTKFPNHDRIIHPDGVAGFVDENLARLSKAFTDIVLANLECAPTPAACDEASRCTAIATRERADAVRQSLEGRRHRDSAELVSEDRQR
jgi:hypothetical protein